MRPPLLATALTLLVTSGSVHAQDRSSISARGGTSRTVQPKIMVIPYTKEGEDIRTVLEADYNRRIAITKVKESFDNRKFSTIDFLSIVRTMGNDQAIQITAQSDVRSRVIEQSRCDIYVVVEVNPSSAGYGVSMILTGYLAANGTSLSNKIASAGPYNKDVPFERIVEKATEEKMEPFLNTMQEKFDDFVENGVPIRIEFSVREGADKNLDSPVGPNRDAMSVALEEFLEKSAFKNVYHVSGTTSLRMTADEVRIPMFDPNTNNNYNPNKFALEILRFLRTLDVRANRSVGSGGTIFVEIQ
jgi:hypothetical protein